MRMFIYNLMIILIISLSCKQNKNNNKQILFTSTNDTIKMQNPISENKICNKLSKGFYTRFGTVISNYYEIKEVFPIDFNNDKKMDTLVILSPLSLIPNAEKGGNCYRKDFLDNRIFLKVENLDNSKTKIILYPNLINNVSSVAFGGCETIKKTSDGFMLSSEQGQGCKFNYSIDVKNSKSVLYISSIKMSSYCPGDKQEKEANFNYTKKQFLLSNYNRNMIDSLKIAQNL